MDNLKIVSLFLEFNPEPCPKWSALQEILQAEIPTDIESQKLSSVQVLILCEDNRTCHQLNNVRIPLI